MGIHTYIHNTAPKETAIRIQNPTETKLLQSRLGWMRQCCGRIFELPCRMQCAGNIQLGYVHMYASTPWGCAPSSTRMAYDVRCDLDMSRRIGHIRGDRYLSRVDLNLSDPAPRPPRRSTTKLPLGASKPPLSVTNYGVGGNRYDSCRRY
jgi:hypothetical protein